MREVYCCKGPSRRRKEDTMLVFFYLEASQPNVSVVWRLPCGADGDSCVLASL